jgi:hypothetical protein
MRSATRLLQNPESQRLPERNGSPSSAILLSKINDTKREYVWRPVLLPRLESRLKTGPAASLTLNFLVTLFEKTFAFAILAFHFWLAGILLHVLSKSDAVGWPSQTPTMAAPLANYRFFFFP